MTAFCAQIVHKSAKIRSKMEEVFLRRKQGVLTGGKALPGRVERD